MNSLNLVQFLFHTEAGHDIMAAIVVTAVGSLQAPTKTSSAFYIWFFKFSNSITLQFFRAFYSNVERSPNFTDAVVKLNGGYVNGGSTNGPTQPPGSSSAPATPSKS